MNLQHTTEAQWIGKMKFNAAFENHTGKGILSEKPGPSSEGPDFS